MLQVVNLISANRQLLGKCRLLGASVSKRIVDKLLLGVVIDRVTIDKYLLCESSYLVKSTGPIWSVVYSQLLRESLLARFVVRFACFSRQTDSDRFAALSLPETCSIIRRFHSVETMAAEAEHKLLVSGCSLEDEECIMYNLWQIDECYTLFDGSSVVTGWTTVGFSDGSYVGFKHLGCVCDGCDKKARPRSIDRFCSNDCFGYNQLGLTKQEVPPLPPPPSPPPPPPPPLPPSSSPPPPSAHLVTLNGVVAALG